MEIIFIIPYLYIGKEGVKEVKEVKGVREVREVREVKGVKEEISTLLWVFFAGVVLRVSIVRRETKVECKAITKGW